MQGPSVSRASDFFGFCRPRVWSLLLSLTALAACGRDNPDGQATQPIPKIKIAIEPNSISLHQGQSAQIEVFQLTATGSISLLGNPDLQLSSLDLEVATVTASTGLIIAQATGTSSLSAHFRGAVAVASVTVSDREIDELQVSPSSAILLIQESIALLVRAKLDDGSFVDLTQDEATIYTSADPSIAIASAKGEITGLALGQTTIRIAHGAHSAEVEVFIVGDSLRFVRIELEPSESNLSFGESLALTAFGVRSDDSRVDLVGLGLPVNFLSSDENVATVNTEGLVSASTSISGSATIIAQYGTLSAFSEIVVTPPAASLIGISVQPQAIQLGLGGSEQLFVLGIYSDGSTADLSLGATGTTYRSANTRFVEVSDDGLVRGRTQNTETTIIVQHLQFSAEITVNVEQDVRLLALNAAPNPIQLEVGGVASLSIIAFYSDGSLVDVTTTAQFTVNPNGIVSVSGGGVVFGIAPGEALITVSFDGQQTMVSARVESTMPTIVTLSIQPALITASIGPGGVSAPFTVEAVYSDGSRVDVTFDPNLNLSVADPTIAQLVFGTLIAGLSVGNTELIARFDGLEARAQIVITGTSSNILLIFITAPSVLSVGQSDSFSVMAVLRGGQFQDITSMASISNSNGSIVSVSGNNIRGLSAGDATITASYQGFQAQHDITVTQTVDPVVSIRFEPLQLTLQPGQSALVNVVARHQSGMERNITFDPNINAQISGPIQAFPDTGGARILAISVGQARIDVQFMGFSASLPITISNGAPSLVSISIAVMAMTEVGQTIPFQVIGTRSDGSTIDLTLDPMLALNSNPSGIIQINGVLLRGLQAGVTTITASYGSNLSDRVRITVIDSPVTDIFWVPASVTVNIGQTVTVGLRARRANGQEFDISTSSSLSLRPSSGVTAVQGANGIQITGQTAGPGEVEANFQGLTANIDVEVNAATLSRIRGEPNPIQLSVGDTQAITVIGTFSDGTEQTLTGANFISLSPSIATVSSSGLVRAVTSGNTVILIDIMGVGTILTVEVASPTLLSIELTPNPLNLQSGDRGQLTVLGNFSDGTQQPLSGASFSSTNPSIANVSASGLVDARQAGTVSINAVFGNFRASARVVVTDPPTNLIGIRIQPANITINVGASEQLTVIGVFSDGSEQVLSGASFSSANTMVASVDTNGLVLGVSDGSTQITANFQSFSALASVRVSSIPVMLVGIRLEPPVVNLMLNGSQQLSVIGMYSDGTEQTETGAQFSSSDAAIANVSNGGLLSANSAGTAVLTVRLSGFVSSGVVIVSGTQVTLISIRIEPSSFSLNIGQSTRVTVIGRYSDGSEQTLSNVSFQSSDPLIATVNSMGDVTAMTPGQALITANISGFSAQATVTVNTAGPVLFSIRFEPGNLVMQTGQNTSIRIVGTYSDGSEATVTPDSLTSSNNNIASIDSSGLVTAISEGNAVLEAFKGSLQAQTSVTVLLPSAPTITSVSPSAISVGTSFPMITITGTGFVNTSQVIINGTAVPSVFLSNTSIRALLSANLVQNPGQLDLLVRNSAAQGGDSNTVQILVGNPPTISAYAPSSALANSSVIVTIRGTNLLSISASSTVLNIVNIVEDSNGLQAELTIVVPNISAGNQTITVSNPFGSTNFVLDIRPNTGNPDLEVTNGQTVTLSGVNVYNNIIVHTGGTIVGVGSDPLVLYSTGDMTIRGHISVDGNPGTHGFSNPANGGEGGPGGGGGGGAGDGNANPVASGGAGSPAGQNAGNPSGAGTTAGNGGGDGGGIGGNGGCGQGGGGGALVGAGGSAGGDQGTGTGGAGGTPGTGSNFGAGTGGGGGSTCGPNSGGGGGGGGGILILEVAQGGTLIVDGTLSARGGDAGNAFFGTGGGGGGSGGRIEIVAPSGSIVINDTISVRGGNGGQADFGDGGGGGGGGEIIVNALPLGTITANLGLFDYAGGQSGPSLGNGFPGESGDIGSVSITP